MATAGMGSDQDRRALLMKSSVQSLSMRTMTDLIQCSDTVVGRRLRSQSVPVALHSFHRCVMCLVEEGARIANSTDGKARLRSPVIVIAPDELEEEMQQCGRHDVVGGSQSLPSVQRELSGSSQKKRTMIQRRTSEESGAARDSKLKASSACKSSTDRSAAKDNRRATGLLSLTDIMASGDLNKGAEQSEKTEEKEELEEDIMENCSLMEYPTTITADSPLAALLKIQELSDEFERKIGGVVTVAAKDTAITEGSVEGTFCLTIKWALPVLNFENSETDPNEVAAWLLESVPPSDNEAMGSKKGIFMDVDRTVLRRMLTDAIDLQK